MLSLLGYDFVILMTNFVRSPLRSNSYQFYSETEQLIHKQLKGLFFYKGIKCNSSIEKKPKTFLT